MMEQLENDPWIHAIGAILLVGSIAPWIFLIGRWRRQGVLLPYEPRRPVPWGVAGAFLAVAFTALTISDALAVDDTSRQMVAPSAQEMSLRLLASMVIQLCGPALLLFIALMSNAKRSDLGLPPFSAAAIARDVAIGLIACLAALMPVRLAQLALIFVLKLPEELTKHPLVEMLTKGEPEIFVLVLATIMAVVVAPIGEEITFRLLLQGWLEKWEDRRLGWRRTQIDDADGGESAELPGDVASPVEPFQEDAAESLPQEPEPPQRGVGGLPYGWTPIILSSLLFAAAHFGYGPEPVPLFVLALILGYCYQRTHRILPCIVAHALFNLITMVMLWRIVLRGME
jgi:membrane protease YdiL (CAAX protease family)